MQVQDPYIWDVQNDTVSSSSVSSLGADYSDGDEDAVLIPFSRAETAFAAVCAILFTIVGIAGKTPADRQISYNISIISQFSQSDA